jgi:hypothetical protein
MDKEMFVKVDGTICIPPAPESANPRLKWTFSRTIVTVVSISV